MLHIAKIIEQMLHDEYSSQFVVIDGVRRDPNGKTYEQWLVARYGAAGQQLYDQSRGEFKS
jgi:hypothetical protein